MAPYVSCMYAPEIPDDPAEIREEGHKAITCIDEQGRKWFLTEDSQVGDWLDYVSAGGRVEAYAADEPEAKSAKTRKK